MIFVKFFFDFKAQFLPFELHVFLNKTKKRNPDNRGDQKLKEPQLIWWVRAFNLEVHEDR